MKTYYIVYQMNMEGALFVINSAYISENGPFDMELIQNWHKQLKKKHNSDCVITNIIKLDEI